MATRFQNVLRGARGVAARDKYLAYLTGISTRPNKIGTKGNRPPSIKLYIQPFSIDLGATTYVEVSALQTATSAMQGTAAVTSHVKLAAAVPVATNTRLKLSSFTSARLIRKTQSSAQGVAKKSDLTGLDYLRYASTSLSIPFGRKNTTEVQGDAFAEMVDGLGGQTALVRFSLKEERA